MKNLLPKNNFGRTRYTVRGHSLLDHGRMSESAQLLLNTAVHLSTGECSLDAVWFDLTHSNSRISSRTTFNRAREELIFNRFLLKFEGKYMVNPNRVKYLSAKQERYFIDTYVHEKKPYDTSVHMRSVIEEDKRSSGKKEYKLRSV